MFPVLPAKIYLPPARPNAVARPRLYQRLSAGLDRSLTLVSAPAGFGKSTLISSWYEQTSASFPLAWITLDANDNEPLRFVSYLYAAANQLSAGQVGSLAQEFEASQPPAPRLAVERLIQCVTGVPGSQVLVLDDYHHITNPEIHDLIGYLIANLPPNLHMIISTRADPPLPLARLRVSDRLEEIRAADLLFRPEETASFLTVTMGLTMPAEDAARLSQRTEGWPAGLQLAALVVRAEYEQGKNTDFSGQHPFLIDYLIEEVLDRLPVEQQEFLLCSSLLVEMNGSLCDEVLERQGSAQMLEALDRANLFLVPLDAGRVWFRYHHLFAESLTARLQQIDAASIPVLRRRAAIWYAGQERMEEAIRYALAAGDQDLASVWIETAASDYLKNGRAVLVRGWLSRLDEDTVRSRPGLALIWARSLFMTGDFFRCRGLLDELERRSLATSDGETPAHLGEVYAMRASIQSMGADWSATIEDAQMALQILPRDNFSWRSVAALNLGNAMLVTGDYQSADPAFSIAIREGLRVSNMNVVFTAINHQAEARMIRGLLRDCEMVLQQGLRIIQERAAAGRSAAPTASLVYCGLAELSIERAELDEAECSIQQALELEQQGGFVVAMISALAARASLELARGAPENGLPWIAQAIHTIQGPQSEGLLDPLHALQARLLLEMGDLPAVQRWAENKWPEPEAELDYNREMEGLVLLRLARASGQAERGLALAQRMLAAAEAGQRLNHALEIRLQIALLIQQLGDHVSAVQALREALAAGYPCGYRGTFFYAGEELRPLLQALLRGMPTDDPLREPARHIMTAFLSRHNAASVDPNKALVEPLSERELEVLKLLDQGLSNQKIADRLVLSSGTVKAHLHHIQGKLGTRSRIELIQRARNLGLV